MQKSAKGIVGGQPPKARTIGGVSRTRDLMSDRGQKTQMELAFMTKPASEARSTSQGTESPAGNRGTERPTATETLMEEVVERENLKKALQRVKSNKGSTGVDGMTVEQLPAYLKTHWPDLRRELLEGTYKPQPVRRVEIPKPDGGMRKLGIPTVRSRTHGGVTGKAGDRITYVDSNLHGVTAVGAPG